MQQAIRQTYSLAETEALRELAKVSSPVFSSPGTGMEQNSEANSMSFVIYSSRGLLLNQKREISEAWSGLVSEGGHNRNRVPIRAHRYLHHMIAS